ncbi:MAG: class I SAM-dependent methyltransferase [Solirubrobacterales bacterium]
MTDWDAATYDEVSDPQENWGLEVLGRLELAGDETVLDAGCGSGRLTRHLLERLPNGKVIGVDASPSMIEKARENLGARVELHEANLLEFSLPEPVDAVFSNATFHWVTDHDRLFATLHGLLRPGGALEAQCGGRGNIAEVDNVISSLEGDERFAPYLRTMVRPWNFASVDDTETRLERSGFAVSAVWLEDQPTTPPDPRAFVTASVLQHHLDRLPENLHESFIDAVLEMLPRPLTLEYIRLNISARKPA